jgi:hypothetical protein
MRISKSILPILVVVFLLGGYALRLSFTQPTTAATMGGEGGATLTCIVDGVKCKGTAAYFSSLFNGVPGIAGIETYATEHRAVFNYDPAIITPEQIRARIDTPIAIDDSTTVEFFKCLSME